jgi:glycosyltransferase involved in cell wall biosynthesis
VVRRCGLSVPGLRFAADVIQTLALVGRSRKTTDVIVAYQTVIDGLIGVLAKAVFGIPVIVSVRSSSEYQMDRYVQSRLLSPFVFRHADRLGVQSQTLADELLRAFDRTGRRPTTAELQVKLFVLPNGVSPARRRSAEGESVVFVGRLTNSKGVNALIDAMRDCPHESLVVVGDGPERRPLEEAARGCPNISFAGMVEHERATAFIAGAKMLVLPSHYEGQPNVIIEAMSLGVPVIATRVGAIPDLISHGESGWLFEPGDVAALVSAIRTLGEDPELRERLAANASRVVERFAWPAVVEILENQLIAVAGKGRQVPLELRK